MCLYTCQKKKIDIRSATRIVTRKLVNTNISNSWEKIGNALRARNLISVFIRRVRISRSIEYPQFHCNLINYAYIRQFSCAVCILPQSACCNHKLNMFLRANAYVMFRETELPRPRHDEWDRRRFRHARAFNLARPKRPF